jgi:serine protease Do
MESTVPKKWIHFAALTKGWVNLGFLFVVVWSAILHFSSVSLAQNQGKPIERSALKPSVKGLEFKTTEKTSGITGVSLEPGLDSVLRGNEPRNKAELIALEKQQTKIAEKVNLVTVNLQHGSTQGSGVIITADGYILTAAHVAGRPNQRINIILHDGKRIEGVSMGVNRNMDAGLVRITKPVRDVAVDPWPHATIGVSSDLRYGQWCIATGHPGGWTPDRPAVLRVGRLLMLKPSTIITDCALIGGDSGGPLFNLKGELIGIHSRIGVDVDDNMHVPVDVFAESWARLVNGEAWGTLPGFKPAIGVRGTTDPANDNECRIARVEEHGPADKAGIRAGDIILKFDGLLIRNFDQLKDAVDSVTPGEQVTVELNRDGKIKSLRLIVGVRE